MWRCSFCTLNNDDSDLLCAACQTVRQDQYSAQHQAYRYEWGAGARMGPCPTCLLQNALLSCMLHGPHMHGLYGEIAGPQGGMLRGHRGGIDPFSGFVTPLQYEAMNRASNRQQFPMAAPTYPTKRPMSAIRGASRIPTEVDASTSTGNPEAESSASNVQPRARVTPRIVKPSSKTEETATTSAHDRNNERLRTTDSLEKEIRIVLIGRTGSGKSATGNTLTGQKLFHSKVAGQSVTKKCKRTSTQRYGYSLQVVDTPGLFDTGLSNTDTIKEVVKCVALTSPGPHAIILVTRIDRFTEEEKNTVEHFRAVFGEGMIEYLFVIFTRKDDLDADGSSIEDFVQAVPPELKQLLADCNHRYIAFNNRLPPQDDAQVCELLNMIYDNVKRNNGTCYTSEMYKEAEIVMKRREKQLAEEMEEHAKQERQKLEKEFQETVKKMKEDNEKHVKGLQDQLKVLETSSKQSDEINALKKEIANAKQQAQFDRDVKDREHKKEMEAMEKKLTEDQKKAREKAREEIEKEESLGIWDGLKQLGRGIKNTFSRLFSKK